MYDERFNQIRAEPRYDAMVAERPSAAAGMAVPVAVTVGGVVLAATGVWLLAHPRYPSLVTPLDLMLSHEWSSLSSQDVTHTVLAAVSLLVSVIGAWWLVRYLRTPTRGFAALVFAERVVKSRSGRRALWGRRHNVSHYVTLEDEYGDRREYSASSVVADHVREGEYGVAHVRGSYLLQFRRIPV